jgi:hypothetical protein
LIVVTYGEGRRRKGKAEGEGSWKERRENPKMRVLDAAAWLFRYLKVSSIWGTLNMETSY